MILHFLQATVIRQILSEQFIFAEGIQISKYGISFQFTRIFHTDVVRVGKHTHDFFADIFRVIGKINAVAKGFAHFGFAICSRKTAADFVVGKESLWLHENLVVG